MKYIALAGLIGLSAGVAVGAPETLWGAYRQFYPSDPVQRDALTRCFLKDNRFDRFDAAARAECYRQHPSPRALAAAAAPPPPNFVDLRRAAAHGRAPQHDVRTAEYQQRYMQAKSAWSARQ